MRLVLVILAIIIEMSAVAQKTPATPPSTIKDKKTKKNFSLRDRLVFSSGLGGAFGTYSYFQISPQVGIRITDNWYNGIGATYSFITTNSQASRNIYGAEIWSRYLLSNNIILQSELEYLSVSSTNYRGENQRYNVPVWFVGGGVTSGSGNIRMSVVILYDLIDDPHSPYQNPMIRIGGLLGF